MSVIESPAESASRDAHTASSVSAARGARLPIWARDPWSWFFSLQVGIVLLVLLTIASIIGTLFKELSQAQAVIYYSWWYKLLLAGLAVNMCCATYKTIVCKTLPLRRARFQRQQHFFTVTKPNAALEFSGHAAKVAAALRQRGYKVEIDGNAGHARRGGLGRWGSPVAHAGFVLILLLGFAASWAAKEAVVRLPEGATTDKMWLRTDPPTEFAMGFLLNVEDFETEFFPRTQMPSKFVSTVSAFGPAGEKLYRGTVEVNNSPVIKGWALHQTSYEELKGVPRYLVSVREGEGREAVVELSPGQRRALPGMELEGRELQLSAGTGSKWRLFEGEEILAEGSFGAAGGKMRLRADQFEPDFVMGPDMKATSRGAEYNNPALKISLLNETGVVIASPWLFGRDDMKGFSHNKTDTYNLELESAHEENGAPHLHVKVADAASGVVLGNFAMTVGQIVDLGGESAAEAPAANSPLTVSVLKSVPAYATVLTATRNPLIPYVYVGCGLMMLGLVLGFFIRRRDVWFMIDEKRKMLHIAGQYRHVTEEFDAATRAAIESLMASHGEVRAAGDE